MAKTVDGALMHLDETTQNAQTVKNLVLTRLYKDGVINDEEFEKYCEKMQVIAVKKSWFKRWMEKFTNGEDGYTYRYVNFED